MKLTSIYNIKNKKRYRLLKDLIKWEKEGKFILDKKKLIALLNLLPKDITVISENYYVDKIFRNSYYYYYSSKHFEVNRFCKRLCFFSNPDLCEEDFFSNEKTDLLKKSYIGFIVLQPISVGSIGRTYLDPGKIQIEKCYLRKTKFNSVILGNIFEIETFPFSSQNAETMTCAETSLWAISEYYGSRYSEYKILYPNDITAIHSNIDAERVLPSKGLTYIQSSKVLKDMGFSPRIYFRYKDLEKETEIYERNEFKRLFHYYIESGIPFLTGIKGYKDDKLIGHAVNCIGHGKRKDKEIVPQKMGDVFFIDSSDLYDDYVFNDDNQIPFRLENFHSPSKYDKSKIKYFIVPLYKRIFLEAKDAYTIVFEILRNKKYGISLALQEIKEYSESNPLVLRFFLTSSRKFKAFRSKYYPHISLARIYSQVPFPKFIWVAELSLKNEFDKEKVFGEIILDATSSRFSLDNSIICIHYPGYLGFRTPDESIKDLFVRFENKYEGLKGFYPLYLNNLALYEE